MTELTVNVTINGTTYTDQQLARFQYERTLHGLHELKSLGAPVTLNGVSLSHTDINWLTPETAEAVSIDTRAGMSEQETLALFAEVEADAEKRWQTFNVNYDPQKLHTGVTEIEATGVTMQETMAVLGGAKDVRSALAVMPEHYIVIGDIESGQRGMEVFGMFGEPVYVHGTGGHSVPKELAIQADPAYPISLFGEMVLKRDNTPIHVGALHEFRPAETGFSVKSTFFCPQAAPQAIADGHTIHFAIEIVNSIKTAFQQH